MTFLTDRKYSFQSGALTADSVAVVEFSGEEGLSRPYRFDILLVSDDMEIDLDETIKHKAVFTIHRSNGEDVAYHGILASFDQLHAVDDAVFYRAVLVPRLWWLSLTHHNQIFLGKTVREIAEAVLTDAGLTALDFDFHLQGSYEQQPYVCQYGESHLEFMSRWLAREGIYYYFEQSGDAEKVIFTDTAIAHKPSPMGDTLVYAPPSGLEGSHQEEAVKAMVARRSNLPKKILLKDYNYEKPSLELTGEAEVDEAGRGEVYIYGEHFKSPEEGTRLAGIRAQELLCRKMTFMGESSVPYVAPGFTAALTDHYRSSFNQRYLTLDVRHEGSQTGYLVAGISDGLSERERRVFYRNTFTAIPASIQFRSERTTEQPKITGTLNAHIDAAGSGKYAELDIQGRYKVVLPFDLSGRKDGKASTWLRMVQPYSGSDHGMHFPLHKGTEVMLTFVEGNPDRPVIAGAAPNPDTPSPVTGVNQTMAKITTGGGNKIHMEDKEGSQRILLQTPTANTFVRIGAPNDPATDGEPSEDDKTKHTKMHEEEEGYRIETKGWLVSKCGAGKLEIVGPLEQKINYGNVFETVIGAVEDIKIGGELAIFLAVQQEYKPDWVKVIENKMHMKNTCTEMTEMKERLTENINRLETNVAALSEDVTKITNNRSDMKNTATVLSSTLTTFAESKEQIIENHALISAQIQRVSEEMANLTESYSFLASDILTVTEVLTQISETAVVASSVLTIISDDFNTITAENLIV